MSKKQEETASTELVVAEKMQLKDGAFYADFDAMKVAAQSIVSEFENLKIETEEDRKLAKGYRSQLNKYIKEVDESRISLVRKYNEPADDFKKNCDELKGVFAEAIKTIDEGLKKKDEEFEKNRKRALADEYDYIAPDLVELIPLQRYIDLESKLTGRTWSESKALAAFAEMVIEVVKNRQIMLSQNLEFKDEADMVFCQTLDLSRALARNTELVEEREAKEEHERLAKEVEEARADRSISTPTHVAPSKVAKVDALVMWSFEFEGTKHQAEAIADFARAMGVKSEGIKRIKGDA